MRMNADWLLGRVFRVMKFGRERHLITVTAFDVSRARVRLHGSDGSRAWMSLSDFAGMLAMCKIEEADAAPFVLERVKR